MVSGLSMHNKVVYIDEVISHVRGYIQYITFLFTVLQNKVYTSCFVHFKKLSGS